MGSVVFDSPFFLSSKTRLKWQIKVISDDPPHETIKTAVVRWIDVSQDGRRYFDDCMEQNCFVKQYEVIGCPEAIKRASGNSCRVQKEERNLERPSQIHELTKVDYRFFSVLGII